MSYSTGGSLPISGRITSPRNGEFVDRTFRVSAETDDLSSPWSAWLAVEIGDLLWAKGPPLRTGERHWTRVMTEGGAPAGAELWIWLLAVRPEGDQFFENWMATGRATGQYPGLQFDEIPTATRLDRVRVTVRTR